MLGSRPLSTNLFVVLMRIIKDTDASIRSVPGVRILGAGGEIVYTPPEGEQLIRDKLENLEHFLHADDDRDPLVKMAAAHYQFEAIHPFTDGNGRSGMCPEVRGKRTAPSTPSSEYHIRRQPPRVREPRSDVGSRRCVVVESGQRR